MKCLYLCLGAKGNYQISSQRSLTKAAAATLPLARPASLVAAFWWAAATLAFGAYVAGTPLVNRGALAGSHRSHLSCGLISLSAAFWRAAATLAFSVCVTGPLSLSEGCRRAATTLAFGGARSCWWWYFSGRQPPLCSARLHHWEPSCQQSCAGSGFWR